MEHVRKCCVKLSYDYDLRPPRQPQTPATGLLPYLADRSVKGENNAGQAKALLEGTGDARYVDVDFGTLRTRIAIGWFVVLAVGVVSDLCPNRHPRARMNATNTSASYEIVDFAQLPGVSCPCGTARRAFVDVADFPATIHVTEISADARLHYHRRLTETYYVLECDPDAKLQLNDETRAVHPGMCVLIRPGVRHRALGRLKVLIVVLPKFDPQDEWFD